jgi:hypothetical protein
MLGSVSGPIPAISTRALIGPSDVWIVQRPASSSQLDPVTLVPNRIERYRSYCCATRCR